jgi:hypothetical protein
MDHQHKAKVPGSRKSTFHSLYGHNLANSRQVLQAPANKTIALCVNSLQDQLFDALKCSFSAVASMLVGYSTKYLLKFDEAKRTFSMDENPKQSLNRQVPMFGETRV